MKELDLILKNIKNKELLPIYFFQGDEPYFIDAALKAFENGVLSEEEKAFDQTVVYGKDTTYTDVLSLARQFPMMGSRQVIILKEAQDIVMTDNDATALKLYTENPPETTLLVVGHKYKKIDARKAFVKNLSQKKMLFVSIKLRDYEVPRWIEQQLKKNGLQAKPSVVELLAQYLGTDLSRIVNELQKLKLILKDGSVLDEKIIETHIGISKDFNVFELIRALGTKDEAGAFRIAHFIGKTPKNNPFPMMMMSLYNFFSNLIMYHTMAGQSPQVLASTLSVNQYFLKDYAAAARMYNLKHCTRVISVLREIDLKFKGLGAVNMTEEELLKEMVYKILHINAYKVAT